MLRLFLTITLLGLLGTVHAQSTASPEQAIRKQLQEVAPDGRIDHLVESVVPGVYEVGIGGKVFYVSADGRYLFNGKLIDMTTRENLSERYLSKTRAAALNELDESMMIIYEPKGEVRFTITTFTDIDCPYCRKMHDEIDQYAELGIRVRYMLYPRAGVKSHSYEKAVSVWCAEDRNEELTFAKGGGEPDAKSCDNPVRRHMDLGRQLGLQGTPMTLTDSGEQIMGYVAARELYTQLQTQGSQ